MTKAVKPKSLDEIMGIIRKNYADDSETQQRLYLALTLYPQAVAKALGQAVFSADAERVVLEHAMSPKKAEAMATELITGKRNLPTGLTIRPKHR